LSAAIPLNALTFNLARLLGPAIGGILLAKVGVDACYLVDGLSYFALVFAALAIRADLRATKKEPQPIKDLVLEGARYTFRERPLRTLFILELIVSMCGIFYIALIPAIAAKMLHLGTNLGYCYIAMAVGTVSSLLIIAATSESGTRALVLRCDMTLMAVALLGLSFTHTRVTAFALLAILGFCGVAHFNITNTMFQLLSPAALRGRVLSMHVWALSGLGPFGTMFFSWLARQTSLAISMQAGACCMALGAIGAWMSKRGLEAV
jgi:MFS family permease